MIISIHILVREATASVREGSLLLVFQPTPRVEGDGNPWAAVHQEPISTHVPRMGGDVFSQSRAPLTLLFQSAPPVRGAMISPTNSLTLASFQPTPPVWGATERCAITV